MTLPPRYALFFLFCAGIASLACVVTGFASLNGTPVFEVVDLPGNTASNAGNQPNQDLLLPAPLQSLPLGAVRAEGWLASQLELMVTGQTGHLEYADKIENITFNHLLAALASRMATGRKPTGRWVLQTAKQLISSQTFNPNAKQSPPTPHTFPFSKGLEAV